MYWKLPRGAVRRSFGGFTESGDATAPTTFILSLLALRGYDARQRGVAPAEAWRRSSLLSDVVAAPQHQMAHELWTSAVEHSAVYAFHVSRLLEQAEEERILAEPGGLHWTKSEYRTGGADMGTGGADMARGKACLGSYRDQRVVGLSQRPRSHSASSFGRPAT